MIYVASCMELDLAIPNPSERDESIARCIISLLDQIPPTEAVRLRWGPESTNFTLLDAFDAPLALFEITPAPGARDPSPAFAAIPVMLEVHRVLKRLL